MRVDAEQIADRVVVFGAVQASRGDAAGIGRRGLVDARELAREPVGNRLPLVLGRLRLVVGRHLPGRAASARRRPSDRRPSTSDSTDSNDSKLRSFLCFLLPWHAEAVLGQERLDEGFEASSRRERRGRGGAARRTCRACGDVGVAPVGARSWAFRTEPTAATEDSSTSATIGRMTPQGGSADA